MWRAHVWQNKIKYKKTHTPYTHTTKCTEGQQQQQQIAKSCAAVRELPQKKKIKNK